MNYPEQMRVSPEDRRDTQQYYVLELGVDKPADDGYGMQRVCALEVGPFADIRGAKDYAEWARGASSAALLSAPAGVATAFDLPADEIMEHGYPVTGCTFTVSTDAEGTVDSWDLY